MSNERRHELEKNELAILLDRVTKTLEPYRTMIALGLGALFIGLLGWLFYSSEQTGDRSVATLELIQGAASQDAEQLIEVSDQFPGTVAADWAKVYQGQLQLSQGIQTLYQNREDAEQLLNDSKSAFESAVADSTDPLLRSRSYLGIARAEESLGNFDDATKAYEQVASIGESDAMIKQAKQRIAALADPKTKEFLKWFKDQDFAPADPSLPPTLGGLDSLPDMPDLQMSELPGGTGSIGDGDELDLVDGTEEATEEREPEEATDEPESAEETDSAETEPEDSDEGDK